MLGTTLAFRVSARFDRIVCCQYPTPKRTPQPDTSVLSTRCTAKCTFRVASPLWCAFRVWPCQFVAANNIANAGLAQRARPVPISDFVRAKVVRSHRKGSHDFLCMHVLLCAIIWYRTKPTRPPGSRTSSPASSRSCVHATIARTLNVLPSFSLRSADRRSNLAPWPRQSAIPSLPASANLFTSS